MSFDSSILLLLNSKQRILESLPTVTPSYREIRIVSIKRVSRDEVIETKEVQIRNFIGQVRREEASASVWTAYVAPNGISPIHALAVVLETAAVRVGSE